jgi:hypothetical protein
MKRAFRLPSLFTSILLLGACQQIIGLGDYEAVDEEEEGGAGGSGGKGGSTSGGSSGKGGKGGSAGSATGGTSGRGGGSAGKGGSGGKGGTSGDAGEGGMGAEGGTGGSTGGSSGKGGSGGTSGKGGSSGDSGSGGSAGKSSCPELTLQTVVGMDVDRSGSPSFLSAIFDVGIQQQLVGGAEDFVGIHFYAGDNYDGAATGSFELGTGVDDNFESCGRCVLVERDASAVGNAGNTRFFATSGSMEIDDASLQLDGRPTVTISDVTLVEVTIDSSTFVSTPVAGGDCYHITSYSMELPTSSWSCPVDTWGDNVCDCGCDEPDLECVTAQIGSCESCTSAGS